MGSVETELKQCGCRYPATRWSAKAIVSVVSVAVAVLGLLGGLGTKVWALAADRAEQGVTIEQHGTCLEDHEERIRIQEKLTAQIAGDVKFIRGRLEGRGPPGVSGEW